MTQTTYMKDSDEFLKLMYDETKVVSSVRFYGDFLACVNYRCQEDYLQSLPNTSPVIAAFVTAQARLKLYSYLERLQQRVLYMDTGKNIKTVLKENMCIN